MKNIEFYSDQKYHSDDYFEIEKNIYKREIKTASGIIRVKYFTSLSFEQEEELGEGSSPNEISQFPLENILDNFSVWVEDFYEEKNASSQKKSYLEFGSKKIENIKSLLELIGKHVFNKTIENDDESYSELVIE